MDSKSRGFDAGDLIENRYRVLSVIGSGGMGTLYRVSDEAKKSATVALKTVRMNASSRETSQRIKHFQREFRLLTQLHHPNLVSVFDYGVDSKGELYFTMEWVEGQPLALKDQLDLGATIPVIVQVCRALAYLHARDIVHGDLKPSNILLTGDAGDADEGAHRGHRVRLVDFGVALEIRSPKTRAEYYTPGYSAPEIKEQRAVDHRADLYSLGALWYALLVGEPPMFMPGSERLIALTLEEALENQTQIPASLGDVIVRLLATSPAARYASANEVIAVINEMTESAYTLETRETAISYALRSRFVGREAEMQRLQTAWQQAQQREGKLMLVIGESGVGKTRLLEEFVVRAELDGARVARGQCVEGASIAFRPWREALRVLIRYVEAADRPTMRRLGPVLTTVLPELWERDLLADLPLPAELEPQAAQQRLNDAILQILRTAAGLRPTVVVIEDVHWADEATLNLLNFLTRAAGQTGLLVCASYRSDETPPQHPLEMMAGTQVERITLSVLSPAATTDLVCSMLGLDRPPVLLVDRVQQTTGGNAFFIQELIRSLAEDGTVLRRTVTGWQVNQAALRQARLPESIRQVVWRRLEHLSESAQQTLKWAAIVGPVFWDGVLEKVGRVGKEHVQETLRQGLEQELIFERDTSAFAGEREYIFANPTVREVSYESVAPGERRAHHRQIAHWLIARSEESGEHLGLIASHLEGAGEITRAVVYLRQAGEQAAAQFANAEAVKHLSRALDLTPDDVRERRYAILLARERIYDLQGAREDQAEDLATLANLAAELADPRQQAEVALRRAFYAGVTGGYERGIAEAQTAIRLAQAAGDVSREARGYVRWGWILWHQGNYEAARLQLEQALNLAQDPRLRQVAADSLREMGNTFQLLGDHAEAKIYYEQSLHIAREIDATQRTGMALINLGLVSTALGDYKGARDHSEQALRIFCEIGDRFNEGLALDVLSYLFHQMGDNETARQHADQALTLMQEIGAHGSKDYVLMSSGRALEGLGRLEKAGKAYQEAMMLRREQNRPSLAIEALAGLVRVSMAQNKSARARAQIEEILKFLETNELQDADEPFRIYLTCCRVLRANQDPRAQDVLNTAYRLLQERAAKISDDDLRRSFLQNIAAHRGIVEMWKNE